MKQFLVYWRPDQIEGALRLGSVPHAASSQLNRVEVGDRLWIAGRLAVGDPELFLVGFLDVDGLYSGPEAQRLVRRRYPSYTVFAADEHALASPGAECATAAVSLKPLYRRLRFSSGRNQVSKLTLEGGHPNSQQLQSLRLLTEAAAAAITQLWTTGHDSKDEPGVVQSRTLPAPALDLDALDEQRSMMARLEQAAARRSVMRGEQTVRCCLCGRNLPASLIVAAHIKPRAQCSNAEKRNFPDNVIAMCKLGCDSLFELGFVDVENGIVIRGGVHSAPPAVVNAVEKLVGKSLVGWTVDREQFFAWRRAHR